MRNVRDKITRVKNYVKSVVVGHNDLIDMIFAALLTQNHVFVYGPPGVAKTYTAESIFQFLAGTVFKVQCSKRMSEDYMIGPPDMKLFKDSGIIHHITKGFLPEADYAIIDEALDAPESVLRATLGILNERHLMKGQQYQKCPMKTAVFATNYSPDSEALEAVEDRFLYRLEVAQLSSSEQLLGMLNAGSDEQPRIRLTKGDLALAAASISEIYVPQVFQEAVIQIALDCRAEGLRVSDRRIKWSFDALKVNAYLDNRPYVLPQDLSCLDKVFIVAGRQREESKFSTVGAKNAKSMLSSIEDEYKIMYICDTETPRGLLSLVDCTSKETLNETRKEVTSRVQKLKELLAEVPTTNKSVSDRVSRYLRELTDLNRELKGLKV